MKIKLLDTILKKSYRISLKSLEETRNSKNTLLLARQFDCFLCNAMEQKIYRERFALEITSVE